MNQDQKVIVDRPSHLELGNIFMECMKKVDLGNDKAREQLFKEAKIHWLVTVMNYQRKVFETLSPEEAPFLGKAEEGFQDHCCTLLGVFLEKRIEKAMTEEINQDIPFRDLLATEINKRKEGILREGNRAKLIQEVFSQPEGVYKKLIAQDKTVENQLFSLLTAQTYKPDHPSFHAGKDIPQFPWGPTPDFLRYHHVEDLTSISPLGLALLENAHGKDKGIDIREYQALLRHQLHIKHAYLAFLQDYQALPKRQQYRYALVPYRSKKRNAYRWGLDRVIMISTGEQQPQDYFIQQFFENISTQATIIDFIQKKRKYTSLQNIKQGEEACAYLFDIVKQLHILYQEHTKTEKNRISGQELEKIGIWVIDFLQKVYGLPNSGQEELGAKIKTGNETLYSLGARELIDLMQKAIESGKIQIHCSYESKSKTKKNEKEDGYEKYEEEDWYVSYYQDMLDQHPFTLPTGDKVKDTHCLQIELSPTLRLDLALNQPKGRVHMYLMKKQQSYTFPVLEINLKQQEGKPSIIYEGEPRIHSSLRSYYLRMKQDEIGEGGLGKKNLTSGEVHLNKQPTDTEAVASHYFLQGWYDLCSKIQVYTGPALYHHALKRFSYDTLPHVGSSDNMYPLLVPPKSLRDMDAKTIRIQLGAGISTSSLPLIAEEDTMDFEDWQFFPLCSKTTWEQVLDGFISKETINRVQQEVVTAGELLRNDPYRFAEQYLQKIQGVHDKSYRAGLKQIQSLASNMSSFPQQLKLRIDKKFDELLSDKDPIEFEKCIASIYAFLDTISQEQACEISIFQGNQTLYLWEQESNQRNKKEIHEDVCMINWRTIIQEIKNIKKNLGTLKSSLTILRTNIEEDYKTNRTFGHINANYRNVITYDTSPHRSTKNEEAYIQDLIRQAFPSVEDTFFLETLSQAYIDAFQKLKQKIDDPKKFLHLNDYIPKMILGDTKSLSLGYKVHVTKEAMGKDPMHEWFTRTIGLYKAQCEEHVTGCLRALKDYKKEIRTEVSSLDTVQQLAKDLEGRKKQSTAVTTLKGSYTTLIRSLETLLTKLRKEKGEVNTSQSRMQKELATVEQNYRQVLSEESAYQQIYGSEGFPNLPGSVSTNEDAQGQGVHTQDTVSITLSSLNRDQLKSLLEISRTNREQLDKLTARIKELVTPPKNEYKALFDQEFAARIDPTRNDMYRTLDNAYTQALGKIQNNPLFSKKETLEYMEASIDFGDALLEGTYKDVGIDISKERMGELKKYCNLRKTLKNLMDYEALFRKSNLEKKLQHFFESYYYYQVITKDMNTYFEQFSRFLDLLNIIEYDQGEEEYQGKLFSAEQCESMFKRHYFQNVVAEIMKKKQLHGSMIGSVTDWLMMLSSNDSYQNMIQSLAYAGNGRMKNAHLYNIFEAIGLVAYLRDTMIDKNKDCVNGTLYEHLLTQAPEIRHILQTIIRTYSKEQHANTLENMKRQLL